MIAHLHGNILDTYKDKLIVEVGGVGYLVAMPNDGYLEGEEVSIYIYTAVRENEISLWGFRSLKELHLFEMLLGVSGVGLKTAYMIMSLGMNNVVQAVINEDPKMLRVPGVGSKTSERIILDMRGKVDVSEYDVSQNSNSVMTENQQMVEEASVAMESLGYKRSEVESAIKRLKLSDYSQTSELVKAILVNI